MKRRDRYVSMGKTGLSNGKHHRLHEQGRHLTHWCLTLLVLAGCAGQSRDADASPGPDTKPVHATANAQSLDDMLKSDDFELPRALLLFSEKYYPEFSGRSHETDIPAKLARFEAYSAELRREVNRARSPRTRLLALTDFVHSRLGLRFDPTDQGGANPENLFFDRMLQNRYGYCVSLSLAYLVFGKAAGLDVRGIRIPGHFAVVYHDQEANGQPYEVILETTTLGTAHDELHYFAQYRFSATSVKHGVYLTPLSNREIFGTLYNNLAGLTYLRNDHQLALKRYDRALELAPNNAEAMYNRAVVLRKLKRAGEGLKDINEALRLDPNFVLALILRAGLFWENGEKDQARADLAEAMRKRPEWVEPLMLEGQFLMDDNQLEEAREIFLRVLEMRPGFKSAYIALAELEAKAGNKAQARKYMQLAEQP